MRDKIKKILKESNGNPIVGKSVYLVMNKDGESVFLKSTTYGTYWVNINDYGNEEYENYEQMVFNTSYKAKEFLKLVNLCFSKERDQICGYKLTYDSQYNVFNPDEWEVVEYVMGLMPKIDINYMFESEDDLEWAKDLISQLRYHEDKESKGYFNAENKRMGLWEYYHYNGKLSAKGEYINDKRNGPWGYYYSNGELHLKGEYINDQRTGPWEIYDDGELYSKGEYINNQKTGPWEYYYYNGELHRKGEYINDQKTGPWEYYYDNGELNYKWEY